MSNAKQPNRSTEPSEYTKSHGTVEVIEESRSHLESLAESGLPASWIAEALLEATGNERGSSHE